MRARSGSWAALWTVNHRPRCSPTTPTPTHGRWLLLSHFQWPAAQPPRWTVALSCAVYLGRPLSAELSNTRTRGGRKWKFKGRHLHSRVWFRVRAPRALRRLFRASCSDLPARDPLRARREPARERVVPQGRGRGARRPRPGPRPLAPAPPRSAGAERIIARGRRAAPSPARGLLRCRRRCRSGAAAADARGTLSAQYGESTVGQRASASSAAAPTLASSARATSSAAAARCRRPSRRPRRPRASSAAAAAAASRTPGVRSHARARGDDGRAPDEREQRDERARAQRLARGRERVVVGGAAAAARARGRAELQVGASATRS